MGDPRDRPRLTAHDLKLRVQRKGLEHLLETSQVFRQFVWTILIEAGIYMPSYRRGPTDDTLFNEGRRSLGLEVLHQLRAVRPDILSLIEREDRLIPVQPETPGAEDEPQDDPQP